MVQGLRVSALPRFTHETPLRRGLCSWGLTATEQPRARHLFGSTQVYLDVFRPASNTVDFNLTIQGGPITLTSLLLAALQVHTYGDVKTLDNAYGYAWPESVDGAHLAVSMLLNDAQTPLNRSYSFDVKANKGAPVPLPAAAWLLLSGLCGLGFLGRRKAH